MSLQDDYRAIHEGAALGAIAPRGPIAVAGADRAAYLQGLLTNDVAALGPGTGCYAAWLTPQGRMLTDMHVLQSESMMLLDVPRDQVDATLARLDQFLFSEDVHLASLVDSLTSVWVHGPRAGEVMERVLREPEGTAPRLQDWPDYHHAQLAFGDTPVVLARISQLGVPGFCAYVEPARADALEQALVDAGAVQVGQEAIDAARIEAGYPVFGLDMTDDTIPLEAGIEDRAISRAKGCYVGQEVIIRVLDRGRGRVARRLVGLRVEGSAPSRAAQIVSGDREVGFVTSAAQSPSSGAVALGYVHRDFTAPDTAVEIAQPGGSRVRATVTRRTSGA
jgi:folate-binding protein YgfZ